MAVDATAAAGDLVTVSRGEVFITDRLRKRADDQLELATTGFLLAVLVNAGADVRVVERAPNKLPEEVGLYLDNVDDVWRIATPGGLLRRIRDNFTVGSIPAGYSVQRLYTLADAGVHIANYFEVAGWAGSADRIREQFVNPKEAL